MEGGWNEEKGRGDQLGWWRQQLAEQSHEMTINEGSDLASAEHLWRPRGLQLESQEVTWVCHQ